MNELGCVPIKLIKTGDRMGLAYNPSFSMAVAC